MILKNLAEFHAVPLALKLQNPELFEKNIKPYCACMFQTFEKIPPEGTLSILNEKGTFQPELLQSIKISIDEAMEYPETFQEPFSTLIHWDMWVNNIMIKFHNDKPVHSKFVDFQLFTYDSPVKDLVFFLVTSVPLKLLQTHFDTFLELYHKHFVQNLLDLHCDISKFSYVHFIEEIRATLKKEIGHILFMMLFVVLAEKDGIDIDNGDIWDDPKKVPADGKEKAWWFVEECVKRKFL